LGVFGGYQTLFFAPAVINFVKSLQRRVLQAGFSKNHTFLKIL